MNEQTLATCMEDGTLYLQQQTKELGENNWQAHPTFPGVTLKTMISGTDTGGLFSSHLVRIEPGCCLETHSHPEQMELHEVIAGEGQLTMQHSDFPYHGGKMAVIPQNCQHRVEAGSNGLTLMAKFFPGN